MYTDGSLSVVAPLSADFNVDGDVDSADLAAWRAGFGLATATQGQGDANGDSRADGADFLIWQRQFGSHFLPGSAAPVTVIVPEPAAEFLAAIAILFTSTNVRWGRASRTAIRSF